MVIIRLIGIKSTKKANQIWQETTFEYQSPKNSSHRDHLYHSMLIKYFIKMSERGLTIKDNLG